MYQQPLQFAHYCPGYQRWAVWLALALVLAPAAGAQERTGFRRIRAIEFEATTFAGGALVPGGKATRRVNAWGTQVMAIRLPSGKHTAISESRGFGEGGCLMDINADGELDQVLLEKGQAGEAGRMVWLEAPRGELRVIDTEADFADCLPTRIGGKDGVAVLHRHSQLRFYELPSDPSGKWPYRDLYSIYTPSSQGGLLRYDVDGNGHPDLIGGNYWFQSPATSEKPWHIFAINKWWEEAQSARLRLALVDHSGNRFPSLLAAEATASAARVALFERPADPRKLWVEAPIEAIPPIRKPEALAAADLNGDTLTDLIIGENAGGDSRLLVYWGMSGGKYQGTRIDITEGLIAVWSYDFDDDGRVDLIGLGPSTLYLWRNQAVRLK